jgi:hypothetical protein
MSTKGLKKDLVNRLLEASHSNLLTESQVEQDTNEHPPKGEEETLTGANIASNEEDTTHNLPLDLCKQEPNKRLPNLAAAMPGHSTGKLIVHITNLVRPFTLPAIRELVGQFGDIHDLWLDTLKTHCYVHFETSSAANECAKRLAGFRWPLDIGKCLEASLSTTEEMDAAQQVEIRKMDTMRSPPRDIVPALDKLFMKTKSEPQLYYLPAQTLD